MDIRVEDVIKMKKSHPCGSDRFLVLRTGMDLRLQCLGCGRILFCRDSRWKNRFVPLSGRRIIDVC